MNRALAPHKALRPPPMKHPKGGGDLRGIARGPWGLWGGGGSAGAAKGPGHRGGRARGVGVGKRPQDSAGGPSKAPPASRTPGPPQTPGRRVTAVGHRPTAVDWPSTAANRRRLSVDGRRLRVNRCQVTGSHRRRPPEVLRDTKQTNVSLPKDRPQMRCNGPHPPRPPPPALRGGGGGCVALTHPRSPDLRHSPPQRTDAGAPTPQKYATHRLRRLRANLGPPVPDSGGGAVDRGGGGLWGWPAPP